MIQNCFHANKPIFPIVVMYSIYFNNYVRSIQYILIKYTNYELCKACINNLGSHEL